MNCFQEWNFAVCQVYRHIDRESTNRNTAKDANQEREKERERERERGEGGRERGGI